MDIYDTAAVQKIWQRVGLASPELFRQGENDLLSIIRQEQELVMFLQKLRRGQEGKFFCQAAERAAILRAIYYVRTGQTISRSCPVHRQGGVSAESLRQTIQTARSLALCYRQAAQSTQDHRDLFMQWAEQTAACASYLLKRLSMLV